MDGYDNPFHNRQSLQWKPSSLVFCIHANTSIRMCSNTEMICWFVHGLMIVSPKTDVSYIVYCIIYQPYGTCNQLQQLRLRFSCICAFTVLKARCTSRASARSASIGARMICSTNSSSNFKAKGGPGRRRLGQGGPARPGNDSQRLKMAIEIVEFPIKNGDCDILDYQRV